MADNFNVKQFLAENKLGAYSRLKEDNVEEAKRYQIGDMWSPTFDYKGMLKAGAALTPNADAKVMQAVSDSFEDVNYHRENSHLQDAIKAKEEGDMDAVKFHLALFKDELVKTIKSIKETQIFERKKVEEGEAAYEYEKGKAAGEKEEKEKLKKEDADTQAEKDMDFLAEYEVTYVIQNGRCYRITDEGYKDEVDMGYCRREGLYEEKEKVEETVDKNTLDKVEQVLDMISNLKSNTSTNSNIPRTDKQGLVYAFQEMEDVLEDVAADIEMEMNEGKEEKKEEQFGGINEDISSEAIDRLEGLANMQDLAVLKAKLRILSTDWMKEGFEKEDIVDYLEHLVNEI